MMQKDINLNPRLTYILMIFCLIHIFLIGIISELLLSEIFYSISITLIFIFSHLAISKVNNKRFFLPIIAITVFWISVIFNLPVLQLIASFTTFVYFIYIIIKLVAKVAKSNEAGPLEFTESISVYLLFGIAGSLIFNNIYNYNNASFSLPENALPSLSDFTYFSFVTLSTLGYGDITPLSLAARSVSIFFSVSGQLYMAIIVAVLVGKYISKKNN